jgi:putative hemolysin
MEPLEIAFYFVVLGILIALSAFFSGSEAALTSLYRTGGRHLKEPRLKELLAKPDRLLSTVLLGNNLVNVSASAIATHLSSIYYGKLGLAIATGIMTFLILTFGEILPKSISLQNAEKRAKRIIKPIWYMSIVFYPICRVMAGFVNVFTRGKANLKPQITEEEIKAVIAMGEESGAIEHEEREMIHRVFDLGDKKVKQIMIPLSRVFVINIEATLKGALELVKDTNYSRIPVYSNTLNNITGILYSKDLLNNITGILYSKDLFKEFENGISDAKVKKIVRPTFFVSEEEFLDDLLDKFQSKRIHMAIVKNEKGEAVGIATLEDVIEEMVGEIYDESDKEKKVI